MKVADAGAFRERALRELETREPKP